MRQLNTSQKGSAANRLRASQVLNATRVGRKTQLDHITKMRAMRPRCNRLLFFCNPTLETFSYDSQHRDVRWADLFRGSKTSFSLVILLAHKVWRVRTVHRPKHGSICITPNSSASEKPSPQGRPFTKLYSFRMVVVSTCSNPCVSRFCKFE